MSIRSSDKSRSGKFSWAQPIPRHVMRRDDMFMACVLTSCRGKTANLKVHTSVENGATEEEAREEAKKEANGAQS